MELKKDELQIIHDVLLKYIEDIVLTSDTQIEENEYYISILQLYNKIVGNEVFIWTKK